MKLLISSEELLSKKSRELIPIECEICHTPFYKPKNLILRGLKGTRAVCVCSMECRKKKLSQLRFHGYITLTCTNCGKTFQRKNRIYKNVNVKGNKIPVCGRKCAALWQHKNGLYSICYRSKLEKWIEEKLTLDFPNLYIKYNDKNIINGELDIYIPSLELAFELNGIYHYEPIYGKNSFQFRKEKDKEKVNECQIRKIELYVIDVRSKRKLNEKTSIPFLKFIEERINERVPIIAIRTS